MQQFILRLKNIDDCFETLIMFLKLLLKIIIHAYFFLIYFLILCFTFYFMRCILQNVSRETQIFNQKTDPKIQWTKTTFK